MSPAPEHILTTERLTLRPPRRDDFAPFARFYLSERGAMIGGGAEAGDQGAWKTLAALAGHWWLEGYGWFVLERREGGEVVGMSGLHHPAHHADRELGWSLFSDTGEGLATEAAAAARDWGRARLAPARLVSYIDTGNAPSRGVAERLGATTDGTRAEHDPACEVWLHGEAA